MEEMGNGQNGMSKMGRKRIEEDRRKEWEERRKTFARPLLESSAAYGAQWRSNLLHC